MRRPIAALLIVLLVAGGYAVATQLWHHGGGKPVAWRELSLGPAEFPTPRFLRFRKRVYLESFLAKTLPGKVPAIPPVDFSRDELILAAVGARSSTGYSVRLVSVTEQRSRIVARVREVTPSLGDKVVARVTYPYLLAAIPNSSKHVHFEWLGRP